MGRTKKTAVSHDETTYDDRPNLTPEAQEAHMISLAIRLAEKQLREETASAQVITHYLNLATQKKKLELEKIKEENKLLRAKTEAIESARKTEELYQKAIEAMQLYRGVSE